ncbi:helix-turn-helix domain-containing protein [Paenibacillus sp. GCM10027626]
MEMLAETDEAIQDIGRNIGYDQSLTFIRVFKKHTGETPGQYRKKLRSESK